MSDQYIVIADLALLVCPQDIQAHDDGFKQIFQNVLFSHDNALQKAKRETEALRARGIDVICKWGFSTQLVYSLYASFPYNHSHDIPWVSDLIVDFDRFLDGLDDGLLDCSENEWAAEFSEEWLPNGIQQELIEAWLELVTICILTEKVTYIASSDRNHGTAPIFNINRHSVEFPIIEIPIDWRGMLSAEYRQIVGDPNVTIEEFFNQVGVFNLFPGWRNLLCRMSPWARANLPLTGDVCYIPHVRWRLGDNFPSGLNCAFHPCFLDHHGRNWEWDRAENHWDIQDNPPRTGHYFTVSPNGRLLNVHGRANPVS